jgi:hypothetical protein
MKRPLLSLALALVSPFAFAQTSPDNGETENPVAPKVEADAAAEEPSNGETENPVTPKTEAAATTTTDGFVSAYAQDEMIAVFTDGGESMGFVIAPAAQYQDRAGQDVDGSVIKEGSKVRVTAETNGDQMVASRIVIDS